ncbi:TRAP transporter large permease subunit [Pikeienuella piscinae]|uniref:TRAP transporter large permease subunit n=2 Tax=Pikeienuella piscinae TaxID=2748098 RepID=A0A7M3T749_9RHOB|nr:TRAP transporter large permease subunit [Pikeienuella piscinae]
MLGMMVGIILLGFPAAFTLMGMGVIFMLIAYDGDVGKTLNLTVQRAYKIMTNDVLIAIPLFLFMGYLVERANLIERLFQSLHVAMARVPGALAVATMATCALFSTATGIVGAVVTLMGLLALPVMLRAGYSEKLAAGSIASGGCLGILIPPSIMLIVYGATASVSIVKLYAGALFPGILLTTLYVLYITFLAKFRPDTAPPLSEEDRKVELTGSARLFVRSGSRNPLAALFSAKAWRAVRGGNLFAVGRYAFVVLLPLLLSIGLVVGAYGTISDPAAVVSAPQPLGFKTTIDYNAGTVGGAKTPGAATPSKAPTAGTSTGAADVGETLADQMEIPAWFWIVSLVTLGAISLYYIFLDFRRVETFRLLLGSVFPLTLLIVAVLGSIVFGLATPTEAAALGAFGGFLLAVVHRRLSFSLMKESVSLTVKSSAMVCWLFVGTSIFSAAFALLGGNQPIEAWVLSMDLSPLQFLIFAQLIIFFLGWPLDWTEIVVIFVPIFLPLLPHYHIDPLFFGILIAVNLQTAFLTPPMAMAAFYLKGVAPPHMKLTSIFLGIIPFVGILLLTLILLYIFPQIAMWLPYKVY